MKIYEMMSNNKNDEYVIAIDLDGVVADFSLGVIELTGKHPEDLSTDEMWKAINRHTKHVEPFFENLPVSNDGFDLIRYVDKHFKDYFFLSATGPNKKVAQQKKNWVAKVFSPTLSIVTVERSIDKAKYATPNTILIDDRANSTVPWKDAGGIAILHKNSNNTINRLKEITGIINDEDQ